MINILRLILLMCIATSSARAQDEYSINWFAYAHFSGEHVDGVRSTTRFDAEQIRPRIQISSDNISAVAKLELAANSASAKRPGTLANVVLDAFVDFRFGSQHRVRFGQFKTPLGMDFDVPGQSLDISKRGMEFGLTLNRDLGVVVSGEGIVRGISYDIGLFNTPGRSQATAYVDDQIGEDVATVARIRFDEGPWHAEVAHATAQHAGGPATYDYQVTDFGIRYVRSNWQLKAEWIKGKNVLGVDARTETVYYLHGGYQLKPKWALTARHYVGESRTVSGATDLANTYFGATTRFSDLGRFQTRLHINYVNVSGDKAIYSGVRGIRDDSLVAQFQVYVAK